MLFFTLSYFSIAFKGWLFKIELSDPEELNSLMDREKYDAYLKSQEEDH